MIMPVIKRAWKPPTGYQLYQFLSPNMAHQPVHIIVLYKTYSFMVSHKSEVHNMITLACIP